jgi:hypothetical protein
MWMSFTAEQILSGALGAAVKCSEECALFVADVPAVSAAAAAAASAV